MKYKPRVGKFSKKIRLKEIRYVYYVNVHTRARGALRKSFPKGLIFWQTRIIIHLVADGKRGDNLPRTGRPRADDPKNYRLTVRFNAELFARFDLYCKDHGIDRAEAVRIAIEKLINAGK